jgi:hypothetical protein
MNISGLDTISGDIAQAGYFVKCILTDRVAVFFPGSIQHRDVKRDGASYEDDYKGNAMAATITPGRMDIRFHERYSDEAVQRIAASVLGCQEMEWASGFSIIYQGRTLIP